MFKLDMDAIRQSADVRWLMAIPANLANRPARTAPFKVEISQEPPALATLAISHGESSESAELLLARLLGAAMKACDHHGDGEQAREAIRADCISTPPQSRADLLAHFTATYLKNTHHQNYQRRSSHE